LFISDGPLLPHHVSLVSSARTKTDNAQNRDRNLIRLTLVHLLLARVSSASTAASQSMRAC